MLDFGGIDNTLAGLGLDPDELQRRLFGQRRGVPAIGLPPGGQGRPMDAAGLPRMMPSVQQAATGTLGAPRAATPAPAANPIEGLPLPQPRGQDLATLATPPAATATRRVEPLPAPAAPATPPMGALGPRAAALTALEAKGRPELHGWKKGLDIAGQIAFPTIEAAIPGTPGYYDRELGRAEQAAEREGKQTLQKAQLGHLEAETAKLGREGPENAEDRKIDEYTNAEGKRTLTFQRPDGTTYDKVGGQVQKKDVSEPGIEDDRKYEAIRLAQKMGKPVSKEDAAWADVHKERKRDPSIAEGAAATRATGREDKSYQFHAARVDKLRQPIEQRMERISRLEDTLNQNTPQADALIAPELLTVMAGGQGSGLRMNEAEIARIIGGRTNWETLKAKLNAWQLDPNKPFSLTPAQRQQTRQLFGAIRDRVTQKAQVIDEESEKLANSSDPQEHRNIYNRLQKRLGQIDSGGAAGAGGASTAGRDVGPAPAGKADGATGTLPDGTKVIIRGGRLIAQ